MHLIYSGKIRNWYAFVGIKTIEKYFLIGSSLRVFGLVIFYDVKLKRLTILMKAAFLRQSFQGVFFVILHKLVCG